MKDALRHQISLPDRFAVRGRLMLDADLVYGVVVVEGGRIAEVRREPPIADPGMPVIDAAMVAPGLIDLQVNGGFGAEVSDGIEALRLIAARLPEHGVTGYLPTLITSPTAEYTTFFSHFDAAKRSPGARALGLHLEGPFLSPARKGAHPLDLIEVADPKLIELFLANEEVRLVTLAPERADGPERIHRLAQRGVVVSLGHTNASYEEFIAGVDQGACMATHLFNAMSPLQHRAPGAIGAALLDDRVTVGLIADGVHTHRAAIELAVRVKGPERIALVSDLMAAAGMPEGAYQLGGRTVQRQGATVTLPDGTLAGAVTPLDQCVRNVTAWTGLPLEVAWRMAAGIPAQLLGLRHTGCIAVGMDADLVLLDRDDRVEGTMVKGQFIYQRHNDEGGSITGWKE